MKLPGLDIPALMPLLKRGVEALERMADALEQANRLTLTTFLERVDDNLADLETENDAETRPAPEPVMPDFYGRNEYGHKVLPPEPWLGTEEVDPL